MTDPYVWHSVADLIDRPRIPTVEEALSSAYGSNDPEQHERAWAMAVNQIKAADPPWRQPAQSAWTDMVRENQAAAQQDMAYFATPLWGEKSKVDPYAQPGAVIYVDPPKGPSPWRHVIFALIVLMGVLGIVLMAAPR